MSVHHWCIGKVIAATFDSYEDAKETLDCDAGKWVYVSINLNKCVPIRRTEIKILSEKEYAKLYS